MCQAPEGSAPLEKIELNVPALCNPRKLPHFSLSTSAMALCLSQVELSFFPPGDRNSFLFSLKISESEFVNLNYSTF